MEENKLEGQVAWVTGASRGMGLSIARRLGRMGAKVALCARNPEALRQAASDLGNEGIEVRAAPADVTAPGASSAKCRCARRGSRKLEWRQGRCGLRFES